MFFIPLLFSWTSFYVNAYFAVFERKNATQRLTTETFRNILIDFEVRYLSLSFNIGYNLVLEIGGAKSQLNGQAIQ